jgi:hypothetical protein
MRQGITLRRKQERFSSKSLSIVSLAVVFSRLVGVDDAFSPVLLFVLSDNIEETFGDEHLTEHLS